MDLVSDIYMINEAYSLIIYDETWAQAVFI